MNGGIKRGSPKREVPNEWRRGRRGGGEGVLKGGIPMTGGTPRGGVVPTHREGGVAHQDGSIHFVPIRLHLRVGDGVVVQHGVQAGTVRRQVGEQHALHCLRDGGEGGGQGALHPTSQRGGTP